MEENQVTLEYPALIQKISGDIEMVVVLHHR